jgi:hypothetical protein
MVARESVPEETQNHYDSKSDTQSPQHGNCNIILSCSFTVFFTLNKFRVVKSQEKIDGKEDNYH